MDRRDKPETAGRPSEEQLQKVLRVIIQLYKGVSPEKLYSEAVNCFDTLIDISCNTDTIRTFAFRKEIDLKYLVDGANFVISKMHFNPGNNYYITLGIPEYASQAEIRERWKRLILLYHPDRQAGDKEWISERAKKVNEAYNTLKDKSKKTAYDKKLLEQVFSSRSVSPPKLRRRTFLHNRTVKLSLCSRWDGTRKYLPRILVGLYIFAALIFIGFIYFQNRSSHIETELLPKKQRTLETTLIPPPPPLVKGGKRYGDFTKGENISKPPFGKGGKGGFSDANTADKKDKTGSKTDESQQKDTIHKRETAYNTKNTVAQSAIKLSGSSYNKSSQHTEALPESILKTDHITKEEVENFMQRYINAYEKNNLETFMLFFSKYAVENNRLNYAAIRGAYKKTFSEEINSYKLRAMKIRIEGSDAFVSGIYNIDRYLSAKDRWDRYRGEIYWRLVKEQNSLKIISVNYDN